MGYVLYIPAALAPVLAGFYNQLEEEQPHPGVLGAGV